MRKGVVVALVIIALLAGWAGYIYWRDSRPPTLADAQWFVSQAQPMFSSLQKPDEIGQTGSQAFDKFASTATSAAEQVTRSIDQSIQVSTDSDEPLTEQALNYARYQYCKQVIMEYEKK